MQLVVVGPAPEQDEGGQRVGEIEPRRVYTVEEARKLLGLPVSTFRLLVRRGEIRGRKAGRQWRFLGSELLKFLQNKTITPSRGKPR